jgi:predicted acetyltransferase
MNNYTLSAVDANDGLEIFEMIREISPGENGFQISGHGISEQDFPKWKQSRIDMANGINLDPKYVPQTTYWLRNDGYPAGISKLRVRLNDALLINGGHIGYCIRPTERGKGYANILLAKTIEMAKNINLKRVLLTCIIDNTPSWKTIEKCGGILEKMENGHRYYRIEIN